MPTESIPLPKKNPSSWEVFGTGTLFFWEAIQSNMELGIISDQRDPFYYVNGKMIPLDAGYKPGFNVGVGLNLKEVKTEPLVSYTSFRSTLNCKTSLNPASRKEFLYPLWEVSSDPLYYSNGKEKWILAMDLLDLEIRSQSKMGGSDLFRPFVGGRAAWISQRVLVEYSQITSNQYYSYDHVSIEQKFSSWVIGPRAGLAANWLLGKGARIYGNGALDLLFTTYPKIKFLQKTKTPLGQTVHGHAIEISQAEVHQLRGHVELEFGGGWGTSFGNNRVHMDWTLGYQFQIFCHQNMFRTFINDRDLRAASHPGDLFIHGFSLKSRWNF